MFRTTLGKIIPIAAAMGLLCAPAAPASGNGQNFDVRFATFNASLTSLQPTLPNFDPQGLITRLSTPNDAQAKAVAEIIQRTKPDVLLINEFDFDAAGQAAELFQKNYLGVSQNGVRPIRYPYTFFAPSNTGIASGQDLNNNGTTGSEQGAPDYGDDAFGFGRYPGEFGMIVFSKYPIKTKQARTFQHFLWKDMPDNLIPAGFYSPEELAVLRLSSKSHWDVPVEIPGAGLVHILAAHPTPPVFDGPEDRNGTRNHDETRFWRDYIGCGDDSYIYDDKGKKFGLRGNGDFVIVGDYNADPSDGDGIPGAANQLLDCPLVRSRPTPSSAGGVWAANTQGPPNLSHLSNPAHDTADFAEAAFAGPSNLRADYVLPARQMKVEDSGVFWPADGDPLFYLTGPGFPSVSSDHRLVWVDVEIKGNRGKGRDDDRHDGRESKSFKGRPNAWSSDR